MICFTKLMRAGIEITMQDMEEYHGDKNQELTIGGCCIYQGQGGYGDCIGVGKVPIRADRQG